MNNQQTIPIAVYPSFEVQQPLMTNQLPPLLTKQSIFMECPYCRHQSHTVVCHEAGNGAFIIGGALAVIGLWMGCCLVPCFLEACKDSKHYCQRCSAHLGTKKFLCE